MAADIREWLEVLGLDQYAQAFAENDIDFRALPHIDQDDLKELGVSLGHRKVILAAIEAMNEARETEAADPHRFAPVGGEEAPSALGQRQAERRQLTVMFCDLVGSTELSARLDPEDLREVMRRYQDTVAGVVARFEGHVAKFLGDGVLAFFGWPRAYEDQAERAVRSGLAAIDAVADLKTEDDQTLEARVGIATGQVVIGDIVGETATEADAVAGETPNLAARLQGLAAPGQVVIGATTRLLIGEALALDGIGTHRLKGFAEPVAAWRVVGESTAETRFEAAHPGTLTQFVGREHELGLLRRAWQQSQAGVGQVVLISGEPGIGKSRLVDALNAELGHQGYTQITLGCSPYHTSSALFPVIVHLERALRWQREDSADVKLAKLEEALQDFSLPLDEAIPLFASLLSLPLPEDRYPPISVTPQQQKQQTLDATVAWLLEEAERQPVLQVWEDLHWADPSTLELLALEIEQAPTAPILNVLTFRPEFQPPWPQRSHMTPLTLNRLERSEVEALITLQAGGKALPEEVVEHIVGKTDGVPLYVEELTKAILEADFLREHDGGYRLTGPMSGITIPATLQDSLMARLDRLPNIREVAQLGAVLGREFAYEMVRAISSIEETTLQEGLGQLVDAELLYQRGRPPRAKYIFKHALVQDAAYQSLLKRTRQQYHQQVARLLEERFPETVETHPELVAHHFAEARCAEEAVAYLQKAGQNALGRSANVEAVTHFERGLELLTQLPETPERHERELEMQMALGPALAATRGYADAGVGRAYARAWELCGLLDDNARLPLVLRGRQIFHFLCGELNDAREFAEQLRDLAERQQNPALMVGSYHALGQTLFSLGEFVAARRIVEQGIALFDPERHRLSNWTGGQPGEQCYLWGAFALWMLGYPDQAVRRGEEALAMANELPNPANLINTLAFVATLHVFRRELSAARQRAKATMEMSAEQRNPTYLGHGRIVHGWAQAAQDQIQDGMAEIEQGIATFQTTGARTWLPYFLGLQAEAYGRAKRIDDGLGSVAEGLALADKTEQHCWRAELNRIKGELLLALSSEHHAEAERCFFQALDLARAQQAKSWELRAATSLSRLWQQQRKETEARDLLGPTYGWFTEGFDTADLKEAKMLLDELK